MTGRAMFPGNSVFIIAEAGVNHNGLLDVAFRLIDAAVAAGADAVKFQTWKTENVVTKCSPKPLYQIMLTGGGESQFDLLKKLELPYDEFVKLKRYCDQQGILFLSTADEIESACFLDSLQNLFKLGSSELTDTPYLRQIALFGKPVIISTGMATLDEIGSALDTLVSQGLAIENITVLHCNTEYPTPYSDVNLRAMVTIRDTFGVRVGYSDHTLGIEVPIAAVAMGASVIEKHFTLDKTQEGPDHQASLEPHELKSMVRTIRNIELALGDGVKRPSVSELGNIPIVRKSIVARRSLQRGELLTRDNLTVKRPGTGIPPNRWDSVVGTVAIRDFAADEMIEL